MRSVATVVTFLLALVVTGAFAFVAVMFLVGPHGGAMPDWTYPYVLGLGWLLVLVLPAVLARTVWQRLGKHKRPERPDQP